MPKRLLVDHSGARLVLEEVLADDEAQLQWTLQDHPDLLPVDDFGLEGPMMVVGRETSLASGVVDLVGLARGGEIVVVEFKIGPQNSDFRHALAQLIDYGAGLWGLGVDEFEATVARRYFTGPHCPPAAPLGKVATLAEAARVRWDEVRVDFTARLGTGLERGEFRFVLAAQRFIPTMLSAIDYLNATSKAIRFYAVELVRFRGGGYEAFEARTVSGPARKASSGSTTDLDALLGAVADERNRAALDRLLDFLRCQHVVAEWGSVGVSFRIAVPDRAEPVTLAWLFPPGRSGWMGLTDLTLGSDPGAVAVDSPARRAFDAYAVAVQAIEGAEEAKPQWLSGYRIPPTVLVERYDEAVEAIADLVTAVAEFG